MAKQLVDNGTKYYKNKNNFNNNLTHDKNYVLLLDIL